VDNLELALKNKSYLRLCKSVLVKHNIPPAEHEDRTVQAIWKTFKKHDNRIGRFTSSLYRYITWECLLYLKEVRENSMGHVRISSDIIDKRTISPESIEDTTKQLEPIHRDILQQFYLGGATKKALRKEYNLEEKEFNELFKEALRNLKDIYGVK
jgi:hypothetical protein